MTSINKQWLVGTLEGDAVSRSLPSGDLTVTMRISTTERYRDRESQEWKESKDYHNIAVFGQLAEPVRTLKRGVQVCVEGRSRTRKYKAKLPDGSDFEKYITECIASSIFETAQTAPSASGSAAPRADASRGRNQPPPPEEGVDEDTPF